jgi:uncharacterized protein (DUF2344 family)
MFITESRLKQIILEEMGALDAEKLQNTEPEGVMTRNQLLQMAEYAMFLAENMPENAQLEPWVQSKITLANDYISKVKHYLEAESGHEHGGGCGAAEEMPVATTHVVPIEEET